jgi:2'-5' RNA ligase
LTRSDGAPTGAGPARLRLFVACDLPAGVERAVAGWQRDRLAVRDELRVAASLHLTLAFLGDVDAGRVPDVESILRAVRWRRAECRLGAPLFLPARGMKRVVALGLEEPYGTLRRLRREVSAELAAAGLHEPGRRPWLPHVTVARFRRPGHHFSLQNVNIGAFGVVRMVLYSSDLEPGGAVHTPLADFPAS